MTQQKRWLGTPDRYIRLRRIESLDLATDYREITALFYADFQSLMLSKSFNGFMFTYAAPRISRILSATKELEQRIAKRVVDTTLLASTVMLHGFDKGLGREAAQRVQDMHSRYAIRDEDFIAVGCEEIVGSLDLPERFGWRPVSDKEREAVRLYYSRQAQAFGAPKPLPGSIADVRASFSDYIDTQVRFTPQNQRLAQVLLDWFSGLAPRPVRPLFRLLLLADLDPRLVRACGLEVPMAPAKWAAHAALRMLGRQDPVPDGAPDKLAELVRKVYPDGWAVGELGTHPNAKT